MTQEFNEAVEEKTPVTVLNLAEKVYAELVAEGEEQKAKLISEGDAYREEKIGDLEAEVSEIIERISKLKEMEKAYRAGLRDSANQMLGFVTDPEEVETTVEDAPEVVVEAEEVPVEEVEASEESSN